jgi:diaminopimelate decarboxylase
MGDATIIAGADTMFDWMVGFVREGELMCDGVSLSAIARGTGTPVHVYSAALLSERYRRLDAAFRGYPHRLHYAIKANATLAVVRHLRALGARADANSLGEIEVARRAGFAPADVVFTGVGKTADEIRSAVAADLEAINVESSGELDRIAAAARGRPRPVRVAIRVNPDVDAETHPNITTGLPETKFGVSFDEARTMIRRATAMPGVRVVGLHAHLGSQVTKAEPLRRMARAVTSLANDVRAAGAPLEHLDLGGGLGVAYTPGQAVLSEEDYAGALVPLVSPTGLTLVLEPGRWLVAPAGVIVTTVVDLKRKAGGGWFVVVDAGMTDLLRPALYGAWHEIEPVRPRSGETMLADVVGPVCETTDTLGAERQLPALEIGDLLVIRDTGAYGAVMASNYNRRPIAAEVMVEDGRWRLVRRRQTIGDMLQWDE